MEVKEYLKSIGIVKDGIQKDSNYIIDIENSNEYGKFYSILDKVNDLDETDNSTITSDKSIIEYESDDYIFELTADFDSDKYSLTVKEK